MGARWQDPTNVHVIRANDELRDDDRWDARAAADAIFADDEHHDIPPDRWTDWTLAFLFLWCVAITFLAGVGAYGIYSGWL